MQIKLNLGCGPLRYDDEIGVDLYKTEAADIIADIYRLPFPDNCASHVRLDHVMEHFPVRKAITLLLEAHRVLGDGGRIKVGVPDLMAVCKDYATDPCKADKLLLLRNLYGSQTHEGEYHKSGWDGDTLRDLLESAGFTDIQIKPDDTRTEGVCIMGIATARKEPCAKNTSCLA